MTDEATTYSVYWDDEVVLVVRDEPGILISRSAAPPPPGTPPAMHPFLTGTAYLPEHEGTLREALERSSDFDGFVGELERLGYRVVPESTEPTA